MGQSGLKSQDTLWVTVGRIGRPFGVKGWVHVHSFTENPDQLFHYPSWHLKRNTKAAATPVTVSDHKPHGSGYILKLKGCDDRDKAAEWTNADIVIDRGLLPELPEGNYYWQDLIGLSVFNLDGQCLGVIDGFFETKANDVMIVKNEAGKEILIPYVPEAYDMVVDFEKETLTVDWPLDF